MSAATLKAAALALLAGGSAWCKKANAKDAGGLPVPPLNPNAVAWDVMGALTLAKHQSGDPSWADYHSVYGTLRSKIPGGYKNVDIESYNDSGAVWSDIAALFA